jgi:hypothetical protein
MIALPIGVLCASWKGEDSFVMVDVILWVLEVEKEAEMSLFQLIPL